MDSIDGLVGRIRLGEDSALELKRVLLAGPRVTDPSRDDFGDELAAFANGRGGTVVLGVDDKTREVLGLPTERLDNVETWVREICNDSVKPPLDVDIRKLEMPDSSGRLVPVIRVDVARSLFVHRSPGGYFRRIGSSKREMPPDVLARLFQERSQSRVIRFDESAVPATSPADLDLELTRRFTRDDSTPTESSLRKLRIVADDDAGAARATVTGILLGTLEPQRWLPHAEIQAVAYAGQRRDVNYQIDARDIGGPLDRQVFEALHFVRRNARVHATKLIARVEQAQFSERAVFEALVNAVAHRDYSMAGARVRLHLFADRMELYVPGSLANTLTPESMHLRQYNRNELIVSLLARCAVVDDERLGRSYLMDRRGDGVPIIIEESRNLSGREPEYRLIDDSELLLVIWAAPPPGGAPEA
ncbi:MAG: putative DNA binding domain-containing protein [Candidatus Eisenbacteria bacterium]|nr:putative DNA binding domain-containing protein [Candidatus Eisenbacteria bacterium]